MGFGLVLSLAILFVGPTARAECQERYTSEHLVDDLGQLATALRSLDENTFRVRGERLSTQLVCVDMALPAPVYASAYRFIGAHLFMTGEAARARQWFRTALELDPTFEWDVSDLAQGHAVRQNFERERRAAEADAVEVDGMVLVIPEGSQMLLDGRPLHHAAASLNRPHMLQVVRKGDRLVQETVLMEGNTFPERFLTEDRGELVADAGPMTTGPLASGEQAGDYRILQVDRMRPTAKTPMMVGGVVGIAAGAGLYVASFVSRSTFLAATTTSDLQLARSQTNTRVLAAGGAFAVGLGVGYVGTMLGGGLGLGLDWAF